MPVAVFFAMTPAALRAEAFSCTVPDSGQAIFADVSVVSDDSGTTTISFAKAISLVGRFRQTTEGGDSETFFVRGTLASPLTGHVVQEFGSLSYRSDVSARFRGDLLESGARLVVELSRPEIPQQTFPATLALWAESQNGTRSMLCALTLAGCLPAYDVLNCETK